MASPMPSYAPTYASLNTIGSDNGIAVFAKEVGYFSMEVSNWRNQEQEVILQEWVREILKKGKILHAFISICLFRMFELLCIDVFELYPCIKCNENTTNIEKCLIQVFSLSQKGYCILYNTYILLKKGCFIVPGIFFVENPRKVFFFKIGYERDIQFGRECVYVCVW